MRRASIAGLAAAAISLSLMGGSCPQVIPEPAPAPGSWLVLLCKASDVATEPHPIAFYEALFSKTQPDLLAQYFDSISGGAVDISGSRVRGWFTMMVKADDIAPNVRNNAMPVTRTQTANDCRASALGALAGQGTQVDPANYAGVITVINVPVDVGAAGGRSVVLTEHPDVEIGFIAHEMLHILGLDHSWVMQRDATLDHRWNGGGDAEYGDCWDIMSFRTCVYTFNTARGPQGPELQAAFLERLGWLPASRIWATTVSQSGASNTITLAPVSDPRKAGFLLAKIEVPGGWYVVEYRERSRFDRGIPSPGVMIRELRFNGRRTYLFQRQDGSRTWNQGQQFTDLDNMIGISVDNIVTGAATITVNTRFAGPTAQNGEKCGDKFRGEIRTCAAGLRCDARRTGVLVSTEYWCQP